MITANVLAKLHSPPGGGKTSGRGLGGRGTPLATHKKAPLLAGLSRLLPFGFS